MFPVRPFVFPLCLLICLVGLHGCGGSRSAIAGRGTVQLVVHWPVRSRIIPAASASLKVALTAGNSAIAQQIVPRPPAGQNTTTLSFTALPPIALLVTVTAFPNADGTGVAQASGTVMATIIAGQAVQVTVDPESTIQSVSIAPADPSVSVNGVVTLTATALDAAGALVLTAADKWQWSVSDPAIASLTANGPSAEARGLAGGSVTVTAAETESGKTGTRTLSIAAGCGLAGTGLANSAWPKYGGNNQNTGLGKGSGATPTIKWHALAGVFLNSSPAIGPDGTLYIGTLDGSDHAVYAVLNSTGATKWRFQTGSYVFGTPAVDASGLVCFGSDDGKFYFVDAARGTSCTSLVLGQRVRCSPAIGPDGTVYVGGWDLDIRQNNKMYALDAQTHAIKWQSQLTGGVICAVAASADGNLYFGDLAGVITALDSATGAKKWQNSEIPGAVGQTGAVLASDGTLCVVHVTGLDNAISGYDSVTGAVKWTLGDETFSGIALGPAGLGYVNGNAPSGKLFRTIRAFSTADGSVKWKFTLPTDNPPWAPVVGADGTVYFGTTDGTVFALDGSTGAVTWQIMTAPMQANTTLTIDADGTLYVPTSNGLFAIR